MSIAHADLASRLAFGVPDRLGKALTIADITSNDMADYLGVSRTTISNYINGRTSPGKSVRREWAMRTGVPFEWIEDGTLPQDHSPAPTTPEKITE